jgi:GntR family transcriptional regulator
VPRTDPAGTPGHTYVLVADDLAARITAREFPAGRLPAERALAREYGVAYQTLRHAIGELRERALAVTRHGRGSYLSTPPGTGTSR